MYYARNSWNLPLWRDFDDFLLDNNLSKIFKSLIDLEANVNHIKIEYADGNWLEISTVDPGELKSDSNIVQRLATIMGRFTSRRKR